MPAPTSAALTATRRYESARGVPASGRLDAAHWRRGAQYHRSLARRYRVVGAPGTGHTTYAVEWSMRRREQALVHAAACDAHADTMPS